jgi:hypothetical protein
MFIEASPNTQGRSFFSNETDKSCPLIFKKIRKNKENM